MEVIEKSILTPDKFEALLRKSDVELHAFLEEVELDFAIDDTLAVANCHFVTLNGNGQARIEDFANFLAKKIIDFAIPRSEIEAAEAHFKNTQSTSKFLELQTKATSLFTSLRKSGEGGEILLYLLIENLLKVPQILCKMNLKTDGQMHVHGCDGIHAKFDESRGLLSLYWGESKLYQTLNAGLSECLDSIKDFVMHSEGNSESQNRDIQLIRSFIDLNDEKLEDAIVTFLDKDNPNYNKVFYKGACLVGFDFSKYPINGNRNDNLSLLKKEIEKEISKWKKSIKDGIGEISNLSSFELVFFLLPFPNVQKFRDAFLNALGIKR